MPFTPIESTLGGALIGLAAANVLLVHGRVAGVSGIVNGCLKLEAPNEDIVWRTLFLGGLVAGSVANFLLNPVLAEQLPLSVTAIPLPALIFAGVLVGAGTRLGNGCTSGHGVCGLARGSIRSLAAVGVFMATGMITSSLVVGRILSPELSVLAGTIVPMRTFVNWFALKALGASFAALAVTAIGRFTRLHTFISGVTFGLGLAVSGMSQQSKVISFLNLMGPWDPSLGFVMAGAVTVSALGYQLFWRLLGSVPTCATTCGVPTNTKLDARLIGGAALFGLGWGLAGLCPGPAISNLSSRLIGAAGASRIELFVATMIASSFLVDKVQKFFEERAGRSAAAKTVSAQMWLGHTDRKRERSAQPLPSVQLGGFNDRRCLLDASSAPRSLGRTGTIHFAVHRTATLAAAAGGRSGAVALSGVHNRRSKKAQRIKASAAGFGAVAVQPLAIW